MQPLPGQSRIRVAWNWRWPRLWLSICCVCCTLLGLADASSGAEPAVLQDTPSPAARRLYEATSHRSFEDVEHWKSVFDDPARDGWQKPREVIAALQLAPGMCVADVGAGTGYFSGYLSEAVGPTGAVLAIETEPQLVTHLRDRAETEETENVIPILASSDNPRIPAGAADLVLLVDTFHHIDQRLVYFRQLKRALKPRGRVAVIDWQAGELPVGPPPGHKVRREQVVQEMSAAGWVLVDEPRILPYQYFLVFRGT